MPTGIRQVGRFCTLISVCFLMEISAAGDPSPPRQVAAVEGITEYQFDNGLRLLLFPDNSQAKVSVMLQL